MTYRKFSILIIGTIVTLTTLLISGSLHAKACPEEWGGSDKTKGAYLACAWKRASINQKAYEEYAGYMDNGGCIVRGGDAEELEKVVKLATGSIKHCKKWEYKRDVLASIAKGSGTTDNGIGSPYRDEISLCADFAWEAACREGMHRFDNEGNLERKFRLIDGIWHFRDCTKVSCSEEEWEDDDEWISMVCESENDDDCDYYDDHGGVPIYGNVAAFMNKPARKWCRDNDQELEECDVPFEESSKYNTYGGKENWLAYRPDGCNEKEDNCISIKKIIIKDDIDVKKPIDGREWRGINSLHRQYVPKESYPYIINIVSDRVDKEIVKLEERMWSHTIPSYDEDECKLAESDGYNWKDGQCIRETKLPVGALIAKKNSSDLHFPKIKQDSSVTLEKFKVDHHTQLFVSNGMHKWNISGLHFILAGGLLNNGIGNQDGTFINNKYELDTRNVAWDDYKFSKNFRVVEKNLFEDIYPEPEHGIIVRANVFKQAEFSLQSSFMSGIIGPQDTDYAFYGNSFGEGLLRLDIGRELFLHDIVYDVIDPEHVEWGAHYRLRLGSKSDDIKTIEIYKDGELQEMFCRYEEPEWMEIWHGTTPYDEDGCLEKEYIWLNGKCVVRTGYSHPLAKGKSMPDQIKCTGDFTVEDTKGSYVYYNLLISETSQLLTSQEYKLILHGSGDLAGKIVGVQTMNFAEAEYDDTPWKEAMASAGEAELDDLRQNLTEKGILELVEGYCSGYVCKDNSGEECKDECFVNQACATISFDYGENMERFAACEKAEKVGTIASAKMTWGNQLYSSYKMCKDKESATDTQKGNYLASSKSDYVKPSDNVFNCMWVNACISTRQLNSGLHLPIYRDDYEKHIYNNGSEREDIYNVHTICSNIREEDEDHLHPTLTDYCENSGDCFGSDVAEVPNGGSSGNTVVECSSHEQCAGNQKCEPLDGINQCQDFDCGYAFKTENHECVECPGHQRGEGSECVDIICNADTQEPTPVDHHCIDIECPEGEEASGGQCMPEETEPTELDSLIIDEMNGGDGALQVGDSTIETVVEPEVVFTGEAEDSDGENKKGWNCSLIPTSAKSFDAFIPYFLLLLMISATRFYLNRKRTKN